MARFDCRNFQSFDNTQPSVPPNYDATYAQPPAQGLGGFYDPTAYTDTSYGPDKSGKQGGSGGGGTGNEFDDEPPLLEGKRGFLAWISEFGTLENLLNCSKIKGKPTQNSFIS